METAKPTGCGLGHGLKWPNCTAVLVGEGWLGGRVVSVLDSGAEGPGSNRSCDAVG